MREHPPGFFDLQQFAPRTATLSNVAINELSVIMSKGLDGKTWGPRNTEAAVLGVKGGATQSPASAARPSTFDRFAAIVGTEKAEALKGAWVKDGDGGDDDDVDYEQILACLFGPLGSPPGNDPYGYSSYWSGGGLVGDLRTAMGLSDPDMRSAALTAGLDNFMDAIDTIRGVEKGRATKAGARHSAADMAHMEAVKDNLAKAGEHMDALTTEPAVEDGDAESPNKKDGTPKKTDAKPATAAAPAAAGKGGETQPLAIVADTSIAQVMLAPVLAAVEKASQEVAAQFEALGKSVDERFAQLETTKAAGEKTTLQSVVDIVKAAREPSAPGAIGTAKADGSGDAQTIPGTEVLVAPLVIDRNTTPARGKDGAIQKLLKRHQAA